MPSAYTAAIYDGNNPTSTQFALTCARAMGALVSLRDVPFSAGIPQEFLPDTEYEDSQLREIDLTLEKLTHLTDSEADQEALTSYESALQVWEKSQERSKDLAQQYNQMLRNVEAWKPPTSQHEGLKEFMREQLQSSLSFDCSNEDFAEQWKPKLLTGEQWRAKKLVEVYKNLAYHTERRAEKIQRAYDQTSWVQALRYSLPEGE